MVDETTTAEAQKAISIEFDTAQTSLRESHTMGAAALSDAQSSALLEVELLLTNAVFSLLLTELTPPIAVETTTINTTPTTAPAPVPQVTSAAASTTTTTVVPTASTGKSSRGRKNV